MKFLVVGASGFIGGHVLARARADGHEALGTQSQPRRPGLVAFDLAKHRIADCVDPAFFRSEGAAFVVVCAVVSDMDRCLTDPAATRAVNVDGTIRLLEDVRALGARPVYFSTNYVFDGSTGYYNEEHPLAPANAYGRHKAQVENWIREHAPEALVVRPDKNVGDDPGERHPFAEWHRLLEARRAIVCLEGQLLSPTYVNDTAAAVVLACRLGLSGIYHVVNPEYFYRDELARQFCLASGRKPNVTRKPLGEFRFPDARALKAYLDGSKFTAATGMRFTPMRRVMESFLRNARRASPPPAPSASRP